MNSFTLFLDKNKRKCFVHQTSWGVTTRSVCYLMYKLAITVFFFLTQLGILVMLHGDDKGMVMPPRVAPVQVVIIPIVFKETSMEKLQSICETIQETLTKKEIRVKIDDRVNNNKICFLKVFNCFFYRIAIRLDGNIIIGKPR
jgi:prolyl-tRNA synthetase